VVQGSATQALVGESGIRHLEGHSRSSMRGRRSRGSRAACRRGSRSHLPAGCDTGARSGGCRRCGRRSRPPRRSPATGSQQSARRRMGVAGLREREGDRQQARRAGADENGFCGGTRRVLGAGDTRGRTRVGARDVAPHPDHEQQRGYVGSTQRRHRPGRSRAQRAPRGGDAEDCADDDAPSGEPRATGRSNRGVCVEDLVSSLSVALRDSADRQLQRARPGRTAGPTTLVAPRGTPVPPAVPVVREDAAGLAPAVGRPQSGLADAWSRIHRWECPAFRWRRRRRNFSVSKLMTARFMSSPLSWIDWLI
jgi:hypothetical protein